MEKLLWGVVSKRTDGADSEVSEVGPAVSFQKERVLFQPPVQPVKKQKNGILCSYYT